ncbi:hypothetical protein ACFQZZ_25380 [Nocardia sp. GCM10030253]|uniref:hypothetical protein n=1 Tax=Nocardia sp. GCM10030253 TaxID=3273404 RepID=UPI0036261F40
MDVVVVAGSLVEPAELFVDEFVDPVENVGHGAVSQRSGSTMMPAAAAAVNQVGHSATIRHWNALGWGNSGYVSEVARSRQQMPRPRLTAL